MTTTGFDLTPNTALSLVLLVFGGLAAYIGVRDVQGHRAPVWLAVLVYPVAFGSAAFVDYGTQPYGWPAVVGLVILISAAALTTFAYVRGSAARSDAARSGDSDDPWEDTGA